MTHMAMILQYYLQQFYKTTHPVESVPGTHRSAPEFIRQLLTASETNRQMSRQTPEHKNNANFHTR